MCPASTADVENVLAVIEYLLAANILMYTTCEEASDSGWRARSYVTTMNIGLLFSADAGSR